MTERDFLNLKSGTDVRGTAIQAAGDPVTLTDEAVFAIARAFLLRVRERTGAAVPTIAVGRDPRLSSPRIEAQVAEAILNGGGNVILTGLSTTPSMFMLLHDGFGADASVMITASHLPYRMNGLKFFFPEGGFGSEETEALLRLAAELPDAAPAARGKLTRRSYLGRYASRLVETVRSATREERPLQGKHIIVDAGNGAGGFFAELVLKPLGADMGGSQFLEPDGNFPNHIPNPENETAMRSLCDAVVRQGADLGIIFDTDVDRAGAVSADGKEINRNRLIALVSAILLQEHKGAYIVTDSVTSDGLTAFLTAHGGIHRRFKRGYANVIAEAKRLNAEGKYAPLAMETSGHAAFAENYFLDDGAYLITRILIALARERAAGRDLLDLIRELPEPAQACEVRLPFVHGFDAKTLGMGIIDDFKRYAEAHSYMALAPENFEGVRVNFNRENGDGWLLVRMSLHEPILPVNAESNSAGGCLRMLRELCAFLRAYPALCLDPLESIL